MGEHGECSHKGRTNVLSRIKRRSTWRSPTTDAFRNSDAGNSARFRMPLDHATPQATDDSSLALLRDSSLSTRGIDTRLLESHNGANIVYIRAPICGPYSFDARKGRETVSDVCRFQMLPDHATLRAIRHGHGNGQNVAHSGTREAWHTVIRMAV